MSVKTAIVTGANGFIGVNLCKRLKRDNWKVIALVRKDSDTEYLDEIDVEKIFGSITNAHELNLVFPKNVDAVFHLAGVTSQFYKDFRMQTEVNITGTKNVLEVSIQNDVGRFIHVSSIMAFGLHNTSINENTISNADVINNNYAFSKWRGENLVLAASANSMDVVVLNPSHIIGPYDGINFIQLFEAVEANSLPGVPPGSGMFCHVSDVCEAITQAFERGVSGEKYLIGGHYLSFKEVAKEIKKQLNKKISLRVFPKWFFQTLLPFYTIQSWFTHKEPLLTKGKIQITCTNIECDDSKAVIAFNLKYKSLFEMVKDTIEWRWVKVKS